MFVRQSKYAKIQDQLSHALRELDTNRIKYLALIDSWNKLVRKINNKGGEEFLETAAIGGENRLSDDEIKTLINLCHPDKHGGKESAVSITQKLLKMRGK